MEKVEESADADNAFFIRGNSLAKNSDED